MYLVPYKTKFIYIYFEIIPSFPLHSFPHSWFSVWDFFPLDLITHSSILFNSRLLTMKCFTLRFTDIFTWDNMMLDIEFWFDMILFAL